MSVIRSLVVKVGADLSDMQKGLAKASKDLKKAGKDISKVGSTLTKGLTVPIVAMAAASVKLATDFESSLAKVATIADVTKLSIDEIGKSVLQISSDTGTAATEINEALYQAISAGADTVSALGLVEVATKAAKGGFTDTATAIDGLTSVLNTYGMATSDAESLANKFLVTQNKGKTTFGELASSIGKVAPTAKATGVSVDELLAGIASLTANGIATAEAVTGVKAALSNVIKPTAQAAKTAEKLGIDFSAAALQSKGLAGFLAEVKEKTGGNTEVMAQLFGSVEALNTVLTLTSDGGMSLMNSALGEMQANSTAVDDAFSTVTGSAKEQWKKVVNELKNVGIELGAKLLPVIRDTVIPAVQGLADKISGLITWYKNLSPFMQDAVKFLLLFAVAIGPVMSGVGVLTTMISGLVAGVGAAVRAFSAGGGITGALAAFAGPGGIVFIVIAAVALLAFAVYEIIKHWEPIKAFFVNLWEGIKNAFVGAWEAIKGFFVGIWNWIKGFFAQWGPAILLIVAPFIGVPLLIIKNWEVIKAFFAGLWKDIKGVFANVGQWFSDRFTEAWNAIKNVFAKVGEFFGGIWNVVKNKFTELGINIGNAISNAVKTGINAVIGLVERTINSAIHLINGAIGLINLIPGVNIPKLGNVELPRLAKGAVIPPNNEFLAVLGDQKSGINIETPLSTMVDAFNMALDNNSTITQNRDAVTQNNAPKQIVINLTESLTLDGYALAGRLRKYLIEEDAIQGTNLMGGRA